MQTCRRSTVALTIRNIPHTITPRLQRTGDYTRSCPAAESKVDHRRRTALLGAALVPDASSQQLLPGARQQDATVICSRPLSLLLGLQSQGALGRSAAGRWPNQRAAEPRWGSGVAKRRFQLLPLELLHGKDGREGVQLEVAEGVPCTAYRAASEHRGAPPCRQHP